MNQLRCQGCEFTVSDAEVKWDQLIQKRVCPRCDAEMVVEKASPVPKQPAAPKLSLSEKAKGSIEKRKRAATARRRRREARREAVRQRGLAGSFADAVAFLRRRARLAGLYTSKYGGIFVGILAGYGVVSGNVALLDLVSLLRWVLLPSILVLPVLFVFGLFMVDEDDL
jgi:hypothetical protein